MEDHENFRIFLHKSGINGLNVIGPKKAVKTGIRQERVGKPGHGPMTLNFSFDVNS